MILKLMTPYGVGSIIHADFKEKRISVKNYIDKPLLTAFGVNTSPSWEDFEDFLESRCFPETRHMLKLVLQDIGVDYHDPLAIIKKTEGRMLDDCLWLEIEEDEYDLSNTQQPAPFAK